MAPYHMCKGRLRRILRRDDGTAAIEFAILVPILIMVSIGVVDIGRLAWSVSGLSNAAREAVRFASVRGNGSLLEASAPEVEGFARDRYIGIEKDSLSIDVLWTPDNNSGSTVSVTLTLQFNFLAGPMLALEPMELTGHSSSVVL